MKEQWNISNKNNTEFTILEEGLYEERQIYIKKTNCCTRCISYLRLIFLLEVTLFFGWGCYMILQTYLPQVMDNNTTSVTVERYPLVTESLSERQESHPSTETPAIFVKTEIVIDKIKNLLENMKVTKNQNLMQNKAFVTNGDSMMQTNTQNSNVRRNNMVGIYDFKRLLATLSSGNLMHDEKFTKNSIPEKFSLIESIYGDDSIYKKKKSAPHEQFLKKLQSMSKVKASNNLEKFKSRNDFTENVDCLIVKCQENYALDASNKLESSESNVATISNLENFVDDIHIDHTISVDLINTLRDLKQKFYDLTKDAAQDDRNESNSLLNEINERLKLDFLSYELFDRLIKDLAKDFSTFQPVVAQDISEQVENGSSDDIDESNEDKHDINNDEMLTGNQMLGNQNYFAFDTVISVQSTEEQHPSKRIAKIKEDENEYEYDDSMEDIKNLKLWQSVQSTVQDRVEFSPNVDKFEWFNMPPRFADLDWKDTSKSSEIHSPLFWEGITYKEDVDDVVPGSQCEITVKMGILKVKCPTIKFDEEWNVTSSQIPLPDILKGINFGDIFDVFLHTECDEDASEQLGIENISENSDKEVTTSPDKASKMINTIELQESATNMKISNDALLVLSDAAPADLFEFGTIGSNKERNPFFDVSGAQQQEQLKISEEQNYSVPDSNETFLKDFQHFYDLEKNLTSLFKNEVSNIMTYLSKSSENNYRNNICSIVRYMRSIFQHPWCDEQYVALRNLLKYVQNPDYPHNTENYYRKKRMTDDLTWQQDQVSNMLEESHKDVDLLENLKKIFQKMEIFALCIDRLHERHLLNNKLDDDYISSEFPIETDDSLKKIHHELNTSKIYKK